MSIYNNIGGANKEISQPYVNIDGTWKEVDLEYTNIDGTWKKVFEKTKKYKINLYRYGELYTTLECVQGSSIKLITVPTVQSDDVAHYGWANTSGSTSRNYATTGTITPTADMDLYAVFSYYNYTGQSSTSTTVTTNFTSTAETEVKVSLTNPVGNSSWSATVKEYQPYQITAPISNPTTSGTNYIVKYAPSSQQSLSGTASASSSQITLMPSYTPTGGAFKEGHHTENHYSGAVSDTITTVYRYSYLESTITYTKYTSRTMKYRSKI